MKLKFNLNNFSLPLLLWGLFYAWRPWALGFYYDDWGYPVAGAHHGAPFSAERLAWLMTVAIDRPMAVISHWFFTSLLGDNPILWQGLLALIFLLFMVVFYRFLKALFRLLGLPERSPSIAVATAFWPCLPWLFGWTAWPCTVGYIFMTLFTHCGERLLSAWARDRSPGLVPAFVFGILCFYYEQFYGQFLFFFVIGWLAGKLRSLKERKVWLPLMGLMVAQVLALFWNRTHSSRGLQTKFLNLFTESLSELPNRLLKSCGSMKGLVLVAAVLFLSLSGLALWRWWQTRRTASQPDDGESPGYPPIRTGNTSFGTAIPTVMLVCVAGFLMSIAFYAAGGYQIYTLGTTSRTANGLTFWLVTLIGLLLYSGFSMNRTRILAVVQAGVILMLMTGLGIANFQRTLEWAHAWQMSLHIMDSLPPEMLKQLAKPGTGILYDGPFRYKQVPFFGSPISLASAMRYHYPSLARPAGPELVENPFSWAGLTPFLICSRAPVHWDGKYVEQVVSTLPHRAPVSTLWRWDVQARKVVRLTPPITVRCDYKSGDDYRF